MFARFLIVGGLGFVADAGLTHALMALQVDPLLARPPAVLAAIGLTWALNRRYTFGVTERRSTAELLRYGLVAGVSFALNLGIYSALVLAGWLPIAAIVVASVLQALCSYFGYRHYAFRSRSVPVTVGRA